MASKIFHRGPTSPEMNMTPLIDVTFQLIIFFMLVNNIIAEESVQMFVPQLANPKTREMGEMERIVVNVKPVEFTRNNRDMDEPANWDASAIGVKVGLRDFAVGDSEAITEALKQAVSESPRAEDGKSTLEVLLRADAAIRYDEIQPVMAAITAAQIGKIHLVAYMPDEGPGSK